MLKRHLIKFFNKIGIVQALFTFASEDPIGSFVVDSVKKIPDKIAQHAGHRDET